MDGRISYYFYNGIYYYPYIYNGVRCLHPYRYVKPRGYVYVPPKCYRLDGCTEMKDIISIIALTCHIITDQVSSLIEVVHQDPMAISIMEIEYHKANLTEAFPIREITRVWKQVMETLEHSTEAAVDKHKKCLCKEIKI